MRLCSSAFFIDRGEKIRGFVLLFAFIALFLQCYDEKRC